MDFIASDTCSKLQGLQKPAQCDLPVTTVITVCNSRCRSVRLAKNLLMYHY